ncbi:hypothetical protein HUJ05_010348 [Dendroctonus ponderosae]|nr:hypothetical protein HUJ05_010348 [Dendroctonus ponderosae]
MSKIVTKPYIDLPNTLYIFANLAVQNLKKTLYVETPAGWFIEKNYNNKQPNVQWLLPRKPEKRLKALGLFIRVSIAPS